jgi:hypothetical protein
MQIINFFTSLNRSSTAADRLLALSHESHRIHLKKSLAARLTTATAQGNLALVQQLEAEAQYLEA